MDLPVRILAAPPAEPVISVDGVFAGAPDGGLNLSHWPGNRTPAHLKRDLSTEIALAFAGLPATEQARLAAGATALVNNHYDTDGVLALFALRHPDAARPRAAAMRAAAAAGDFFHWPDDRALAIDALVTALSQDPASPVGVRTGEDHVARWERCTHHLLEVLPALLDGDLAAYAPLWEPVLARALADRETLARCAREERVALDLTLWRSDEPADPGRHALFGTSPRDRALVLAADGAGTRCRLVVSTLSWFDLVSTKKPPRPDLERLAARLDGLEGTAPDAPLAWRAQPTTNASPELWFGGAEVPSFAEHNPALAASRLAPQVVEAEVIAALEAASAR